ncbi:MAG: uncharacterized protein PWQ82_1225 [Thermosediminibacterales bacterium]|nr:uncharacterized protein [Thermosediminibacterales bacterium]
MYWEKPGRDNTKATVQQVLKAAKEKGIKDIVVASNTGETAELFKNSGLNVVCVTHVNGYANPGEMEISQEKIEELKKAGIKVLTTTHVLSGAERGISKKFGGVYPVEIIAHSLRMLGQGVKVCVEIAVMALDAGLIPYGQEVIAVGGTGRGADTAVVMTPSHASSIFNTWISEIICKPRNRK